MLALMSDRRAIPRSGRRSVAAEAAPGAAASTKASVDTATSVFRASIHPGNDRAYARLRTLRDEKGHLPMASAELSRRRREGRRLPAAFGLSELQRREFHAALLRAGSSKI